jgi:hypothetical protein
MALSFDPLGLTARVGTTHSLNVYAGQYIRKAAIKTSVPKIGIGLITECAESFSAPFAAKFGGSCPEFCERAKIYLSMRSGP